MKNMENPTILIASDIHGDAQCTELLLRRFHEEKAEHLVLLGDLLYHGPRNDLPEGYAPKRVIELLNGEAEHILAVRGNCESEVDQMVLRFPVLADYAVLLMGGRRLYLSHGHRYHWENPMPLSRGDLLLCGHTHVPTVIPFGENNLYFNPGSVSIPKDGSEKSYMTYDGEIFSWKSLLTGETLRTYRP